MPRYRIDENQINEDTDFVLSIHEKDGEIYALMRNPLETYSVIKPVAEAIAVAEQQVEMRHLKSHNIEVVVVDPDRLWPSELGLLFTHPHRKGGI